jgi:HD superfamily phosphohydrolase
MNPGLLFNDEEPESSPTAYKELVKHQSAVLEENAKEIARLKKALSEKEEDEELKKKYRPDKTFGIAVSGDVMLNKMEIAIVNTPVFQRLAFVNQLGSTTTVYRSANHTRFEHSLGVLKTAQRMVNKIMNNKHSELDERHITEEETQIIRLLALLHDIGHMPFGHTIEDEFNIFPSHDRHESRWLFFLGPDSEIGKIIIEHWGKDNEGTVDKIKGVKFHDRFFKLIKCEKDFNAMPNDAFMYDIVSNTVCADLLDYLNRDCAYTNLKLNFHPRFLDYLTIKKVKDKKSGQEQRRIVIRLCKISKQPRKDILSELVQLLRNRYYLGERVYYHHTKIKTGTLIAGAVLRAKKADFFKCLNGHSETKKYENGDSPVYEVHNWGDLKLLTLLEELETGGKKGHQKELLEGAKSLAKNYLNRVVYHQLDLEDQNKLGLNARVMQEVSEGKLGKDKSHILEVRLKNEFGDPNSRLAAEDFLVDLLPEMHSGDFLIYFPSYKMQMKLADVKIEEDDGEVRSLRESKIPIVVEECEEIIKKHKSLWALRVFIHPRFMNKEHPMHATYRLYVRIMQKYCKWIFGRNETEMKEFSEEFWKELIGFKIDTELDGHGGLGKDIYNPVSDGNGKKHRLALIEEIAVTLSGQTKSTRLNADILKVIREKFEANSKVK